MSVGKLNSCNILRRLVKLRITSEQICCICYSCLFFHFARSSRFFQMYVSLFSEKWNACVSLHKHKQKKPGLRFCSIFSFHCLHLSKCSVSPRNLHLTNCWSGQNWLEVEGRCSYTGWWCLLMGIMLLVPNRYICASFLPPLISLFANMY